MQNKKREYFGEQTRRGIENFVIHRGELSAPAESETAGGCQNRLPREFIRSLAEVKEAVFRGIQEAEHRYPEPLFTTLMEVLEEIRVGAWDDQFPIPLSQGGAGTSIHMNFNEVVSAIIEERIGLSFHPLEEGARYQSTNDIIPTAVIVTVFRGLLMVEEETIRFQQILVEKERQWRGLSW
jgi:aspartate ammonia-lyase